jgi:hypothetical protein
MFQGIGNILGTAWSIVGGIVSIIALIIGLVTLFFGRKLFWVFAALVGLAVGLLIGSQFLQDYIPVVRIVAACLLAAGFAILAIYTEKVMIILSGFFGVGLLGYFLGSLFQLTPLVHWIIFLAGGVLGAVLISKYMQWAIVVISSILGAVLAGAGLSGITHFNFLIDLFIFLVLLAGGFFFQSRNLKK